MPAYQGRDIFSAARQGTEEPPCVLASLAMSLTEELHLWPRFRASSDSRNDFFAY
jgi:hypothetical protein